jgi:hypothetical protein
MGKTVPPLAIVLALAFGPTARGGGRAETRISVRAAFPTGTIADGAVEVRYEAAPGAGAEIAQVAYSINGGPWEYVYLRGGDGTSQKGRLGDARVLLAPGENRVVFRATDSAGGTATYAIPGAPVYDFGAAPDRAAASLGVSAAKGSVRYVKDRIIVIAKNGVTGAQVAEAAQTIGGAVVAQVNPVGMYWLHVPGLGAEARLKVLCGRLLADRPDLFAAASLDTLRPMRVPKPCAAAGGALATNAAHTNDPWWDGYYQWGLTAMDVPGVWDAYGGRLHDTKVGAIDTGFRLTHEDLRLPESNVYNRNMADKSHGSHVMGTIGAIHNNGKGLAGVMDAKRASLYGYDAFVSAEEAYDSDAIAGLAWNVANGAKVINFSLGSDGTGDPKEEDALYSAAMRNLLGAGHDFVVVHAAGNMGADADRNGAFASVTDQALRRRIITVGAVDSGYEMAYFTNYGPLVDVVAPGVNIYSVWADSDSSYSSYGGTSMAAPQVTGLAGLVWSADPGLTGDMVKLVIVDSAWESGRAVADARASTPYSERRTYHMVNAKAAVDKVIGGSYAPAPVSITSPVKGLFVWQTTTFSADQAVVWTASAPGSIDQQGRFTALGTPRLVTITATRVHEPSIKASVQLKVSAADFDGNTKTNPQLLGLADAFGSTAGPNLVKYDFDNSGMVDDGDLKMLFEEMEWGGW